MLVLPQEVEVEWNREYKYYVNKGYIFTNVGDVFMVNILDLKISSKETIKCYCDYCLEDGIENIIEKKYIDYLQQRRLVKKDCCKKCYPQKVKEVVMTKYGFESINQLDFVKEKKKEVCQLNYGVDSYTQTDEYLEKVKNTNLEKYGVEFGLQNEEVKNKIKQTNLERYGCENPFGNEEVKEKIIQNNLEKYGVKSYTQTEECQQKRKQTNLDKYGVENYVQTEEYKERVKITNLEIYGTESPLQNEEIREKIKQTNLLRYGFINPMQNEDIKEKTRNTFYKNSSGICSSQQRYLHTLLGGELNYPLSKTMVDIAFLNEMIYVEYDGSGHNLSVKLNQISQEDFNKREKRRWYALYRLGWKEIRIISRQDKLPSDEVIFLMIEYAKDYINSGHSWVNFDIDNSKILKSTGNINVDFGKLRKIKKIA